MMNGTQQLLTHSLDANEQTLRDYFTKTPDLVYCHLLIGEPKKRALLVYLNTLVDKNSINNNVINPLLFETKQIHTIADIQLPIGSKSYTTKWEHVIQHLFQGETALLLDGDDHVLLLDTQGWPQRAIAEPQIESSLKGAHQGFIETCEKNIALIRRYLPHQQLKIEETTVGRRGHTPVALLYLEDVTHPEVLQELKDRIEQVDVDTIVNTGELMQHIEDNPFSPFPQFLLTERPDAAVSNLLQGRIVIVVDRSPSVMIGPMTFITFFQTVDDYSTRWMIASFLRLLRLLAFFMAIFLPSAYIAALSFHYEIIPLNLLLTIGESRERVPIPPILEAVLMELAIEMLREAGLRLPAPIGQTVGIVGGVVIGQAAVEAGIVSNIMVVIVSLTAIASFIIPNPDMSESIRLLRFPMMIAASLFGLVGMVIGFMLIIGHLISLESLGTPEGSPFSPARLRDWKDTILRFPLWMMRTRPLSARPTQLTRQKKFRK